MPRSSPASPAPTQAVRRGGRRRNAPRAPSQFFFSLQVADHPGGARGDPQHPAAEPTPAQHNPEAAVTGASSKRSQDPRAGELLAALILDAPAYKMPLRSNEAAHPVPSYLPDIAAHSLSLWFAVASPAGVVLDAERVVTFDHLGARRRRESEDEPRRGRSRTSPSSSASSTSLPRRRAFVTATPVSSALTEEDDA
jgi:hypothetical protein